MSTEDLDIQLELKEYSILTLDEIQSKVIGDFDKYYNADKNIINIELLGIVLKRNHKILLGYNKLYKVSKQIKYDHPSLFDKDDEE